jgi:hypothetical protein
MYYATRKRETRPSIAGDTPFKVSGRRQMDNPARPSPNGTRIPRRNGISPGGAR